MWPYHSIPPKILNPAPSSPILSITKIQCQQLLQLTDIFQQHTKHHDSIAATAPTIATIANPSALPRMLSLNPAGPSYVPTHRQVIVPTPTNVTITSSTHPNIIYANVHHMGTVLLYQSLHTTASPSTQAKGDTGQQGPKRKQLKKQPTCPPAKRSFPDATVPPGPNTYQPTNNPPVAIHIIVFHRKNPTMHIIKNMQ
jgi:hypothetical protein